MGQQAKLKAVRREEQTVRAGTVRLLSVKIEGQVVAFDEHGRAIPEGTGPIEPVFLMEADIPAALTDLIRKKNSKLSIEVIEPKPEAESRPA